MVGTRVRHALTFFGTVWALLGAAEATCSITTSTCPDGKYCKHGSFPSINSCESCPSHCRTCGSKTTGQSSRGTCTECMGNRQPPECTSCISGYGDDNCETQFYRVCVGACCEDRQFADTEGKTVPERAYGESGATMVQTGTIPVAECGTAGRVRMMMCTSGVWGGYSISPGLRAAEVVGSECVLWTDSPQHCPTGYPDGYPACGGPECSGSQFDGPNNYRGTTLVNGRTSTSCCVGQLLSIHNAEVRCKEPQYYTFGGEVCPNHFGLPPPPPPPEPPPPPSDCQGYWLDGWGCGSDCKPRWHENKPQIGSGAACPTCTPTSDPPCPTCNPGDGSCPPARVDCEGSWSPCASNCARTWIQTKAPTSIGTPCQTSPPACEYGDGACAVECGVHSTVSSDGKSCECDADYYNIRNPSASSSRSSGPSRVEQVSKAACPIHCQSSVHCGEHGRCDGATMANLTSATYQTHPDHQSLDHQNGPAVVCACDDGWGVLSYDRSVQISFSVDDEYGDIFATPDCRKRDEQCTDGVATVTAFTMIVTVLLYLPICFGGCCYEPVDDAARGRARPLLRSWDGVCECSRRNWTRPCVLLLPATAGFTIASAIMLWDALGEYTWKNCEAEAAIIAILCVVVVAAAGFYMISRSPTGCLPPKETDGLRESLVINRAESFMNAHNLGACSTSAPSRHMTPVAVVNQHTHVVRDDVPESNGLAFRHVDVNSASSMQPELISPALAPKPELEQESERPVWEGDADVVRAFYKEHVPEKSDNEVEAVLAKYAGREAKLLAKMQKKYLAGGSTTAEQPQPQPQGPGPGPGPGPGQGQGQGQGERLSAAMGVVSSTTASTSQATVGGVDSLMSGPRVTTSLEEFYAAHKFERFASTLDELGVIEIAELADVTDEQLAAMGMSHIHIKRLRRALDGMVGSE